MAKKLIKKVDTGGGQIIAHTIVLGSRKSDNAVGEGCDVGKAFDSIL